MEKITILIKYENNYSEELLQNGGIMKKVINTPNAPAAIGPYSQAIEINNMIYTSGIIPINPQNGSLVEGTIEEQTKQVFENLKALLRDSGSSIDNVIKTTVFIKNMNVFSANSGQYNNLVILICFFSIIFNVFF